MSSNAVFLAWPRECYFDFSMACRTELHHSEYAFTPAALYDAIDNLREEGRWRLYKHLEPTDEQVKAYCDMLAGLDPRRTFPPIPWKDWRDEPLPEPIVTNIRDTGRDSILITMLFGAKLKPSAEQALRSSMSDTAESHSGQ